LTDRIFQRAKKERVLKLFRDYEGPGLVFDLDTGKADLPDPDVRTSWISTGEIYKTTRDCPEQGEIPVRPSSVKGEVAEDQRLPLPSCSYTEPTPFYGCSVSC